MGEKSAAAEEESIVHAANTPHEADRHSANLVNFTGRATRKPWRYIR